MLRPDAANVRKVLHDATDAVGLLRVDVVGRLAARVAREVVKVSLARETHPIADAPLARYDLLRVLHSTHHVRICTRGGGHERVLSDVLPRIVLRRNVGIFETRTRARREAKLARSAH